MTWATNASKPSGALGGGTGMATTTAVAGSQAVVTSTTRSGDWSSQALVERGTKTTDSKPATAAAAVAERGRR